MIWFIAGFVAGIGCGAYAWYRWGSRLAADVTATAAVKKVTPP